MASMENRTKLVLGILVLMLTITVVGIYIASIPPEEEQPCPTRPPLRVQIHRLPVGLIGKVPLQDSIGGPIFLDAGGVR